MHSRWTPRSPIRFPGTAPSTWSCALGLVSHVELAWQQPTYRRFVGLLQRRCRVICFDKRGTGLSDPTDSPPTIDMRVTDLAAVMDAAGSARAILFGVSDGGRGAVACAAARPERVAGLILFGTSYRGPRAGLLRYRGVQNWGEGRLLDLGRQVWRIRNPAPLPGPSRGRRQSEHGGGVDRIPWSW